MVSFLSALQAWRRDFTCKRSVALLDLGVPQFSLLLWQWAWEWANREICLFLSLTFFPYGHSAVQHRHKEWCSTGALHLCGQWALLQGVAAPSAQVCCVGNTGLGMMSQKEGHRTELLVSTTCHRVVCWHLSRGSGKQGLCPGLLPFTAMARLWHCLYDPKTWPFIAESPFELALVPQFIFNTSPYTGWL